MPALGVAQETGRLVEWLRAEGEQVAHGEPLFEVETDKVTVTIEAPASGTLAGVRAAQGEEVPVGRVIATILAPGEEPAAERSPAGPEEVAAPSTAASHPSGSGASRKAHGPAAPAEHAAVGSRTRPASPLARRRAREAGVDLSAIPGSGPGGAVTAADLEAAMSSGDGGTAGSGGRTAEIRQAEGPIWRRMAERVTASWTSVPHFYLFRDVDAGRLMAWRTALDAEVTLTDLLVLLVGRALRRHPEANGRWDGGLVRSAEVNVGIAVAVDQGLVVPVVHGADALDPGQVAERRKELIGRARAGTLRPEDVAGGTFTVSNLGMYGVDAFAAVINAPQAAILSVGRVADRVVAVEGTPRVRPGLSLVLSCDHRALDGARAASFLDDLARLIEEPLRLMS